MKFVKLQDGNSIAILGTTRCFSKEELPTLVLELQQAFVFLQKVKTNDKEYDSNPIGRPGR